MKMTKGEMKKELDSQIDIIVNLTDNLAERASNNPNCQGLIYQLDRLILNLKKLLRGDNNESKR